MGGKGIELSRGELERWAGRPLTDDEVAVIAECIPHSSVPDAIETIANEAVPARLAR